MDSVFLPKKKVAAFGWADLPAELLAIISGGLQNRADLVRFRWVCRSWRFSVPPLPNKLSPFFPLTLPYPHPVSGNQNLTINTSVVYLLRHRRRRHPWKTWMVSVQEPVAGKLVLRDALTEAEIGGGGPPGDLLDLSPEDWMLTRVATSYSYHIICKRCTGIMRTKKAGFITNCKSGSFQLAGLCEICDYKNYSNMCSFFELGSSGEVRDIKLSYSVPCPLFIYDFVKFKGGMYAIDEKGFLYLVDYKKSRLLPINDREFRPSISRMWLVVSDGDLYVVMITDCYEDKFTIYRLSIIWDDENNGTIKSGEWQKVRDLGERVFFLTTNCSFSVSAQDLPRPWKGNCIVYVRYPGDCCYNPRGYYKKKIYVFFVGGQRPRLRSMSLLQGYSDLFDPPSSCPDSYLIRLIENVIDV